VGRVRSLSFVVVVVVVALGQVPFAVALEAEGEDRKRLLTPRFSSASEVLDLGSDARSCEHRWTEVVLVASTRRASVSRIGARCESCHDPEVSVAAEGASSAAGHVDAEPGVMQQRRCIRPPVFRPRWASGRTGAACEKV